ncbi:hypothetical protein R1sor_017084 [Riccia sorocarpa]|uniref:DUF7869 domain-containing protein n=1 Tax=Riccia sorocarpa TaxID=122646 RepID=A0ABD3I5S9_9MARC
METVDMTAISRVAFDSLWKKKFPNYGIHNGSAFAKCLLCVKFITMLQRERRSAERAKQELDREKHLKHQMSGRTVYYSHRELSTSSPSLYLSFIHDVMELAKTIIPRLCDKVKTLMGSAQPLPLKVIGILNHGHEPGVVAHVTVGGLWKSDPNYTITSIAKQFRDYKNFHTDKKLGDLHFTDQTSHPLFNALMDEEVFNTTILAGREYCCKMITMSFLVVGHTHEDVDVFFSKVNATQGVKDIESLPHFLAVVYHAQSSKAYPRVIQDVADYKEHVKEYMEKITGQSAPVAFRFYILGGPSIGNLALVIHHGEAQEELRVRNEIFVGAASTRKFVNFVPMIDIANGLMLLIRPSDDFECQDCLWV